MEFNFFKKRKVEKLKSQYVKGEMALFDFLDSVYSGNKVDFPYGGFGTTRGFDWVDLVSLQVRSMQLYNENPYAASIINRIVTKTVNSGYRVRTTPIKKVLNFLPNEYFKDFSEKTESLFYLWSKNEEMVCFKKQMTLSEMQSVGMRSALIYGDCLCIQFYNKLGLPVYELIDGVDIRTPYMSGIPENIIDGVEYNRKGQVVAYHIYRYDTTLMNFEFVRVPARDRSGRLKAWLIKANHSKTKTVRGNPLLGVVLQNLNDVGRYLDSEQRAALVNSIIAVVHQKDPQAIDAIDRFKKAGITHTVTETEGDGTTKDVDFKKLKPGFFATNLEAGETIKSFDTSRPNVNFGNFTDVVTKPMFYVHGIPPEVLKMEYNSNYSASRAAIIDFEHRARELNFIFNTSFSTRVYCNWLDGMVLRGDIKAPGYIDSLKNPAKWFVLGAYRSHVWRGLPKINIDGYKQAKENEIAVAMGLQTREQIADEQYATDFESNADTLEKEAEKMKIIKEKSGELDGISSNK